ASRPPPAIDTVRAKLVSAAVSGLPAARKTRAKRAGPAAPAKEPAANIPVESRRGPAEADGRLTASKMGWGCDGHQRSQAPPPADGPSGAEESQETPSSPAAVWAAAGGARKKGGGAPRRRRGIIASAITIETATKQAPAMPGRAAGKLTRIRPRHGEAPSASKDGRCSSYRRNRICPNCRANRGIKNRTRPAAAASHGGTPIGIHFRAATAMATGGKAVARSAPSQRNRRHQ